jgi:hypothetical protein
MFVLHRILVTNPTVLTGPTDQVAAALEAFFWPKIFWDFLTTNFDPIVKPFPILQIINLCFGILALAWEWPVKQFAGTWLHQSIEFRLLVLPLLALTSVLMYQSTNAGLYYLVGMVVYFWGYSEGEVRSPGLACVSDVVADLVPDCMREAVGTTQAREAGTQEARSLSAPLPCFTSPAEQPAPFSLYPFWATKRFANVAICIARHHYCHLSPNHDIPA